MFFNLSKPARRLSLTAFCLLLLSGCMPPAPVTITALPEAVTTEPSPIPSATSTPVPLPSSTIPADTPAPLPAETASPTPPPTLAPAESLTAEAFLSGQTLADVPYCSTPGGEPLLMDVSFPVGEARFYPAVVFIHGGGLESGDKKNLPPLPDPTQLVVGGNIFVSINYRLAPDSKFPAQMVDVECALRSLRAHAGQYFIDPQRIAAMGYSSGSHLAALLATEGDPLWNGGDPLWNGDEFPEQSSRVQAAVILAGPAQGQGVLPGANQRWLEEVYGTSDTSSEVIQKAAPLAYVSPDDPPFLILHGMDDTVIPISQAQMMEKALRENGVEVEFIPVIGTGHDVLAPWAQTQPSYKELIQRIQGFLTKALTIK